MNIGQFLAQAAERHPDKPALVRGDRKASYAETNARVNALAAGLQTLGVTPGDRVGIIMHNSPQLIESFFAIWKAGACAVPLNARFRAGEVGYHLDDSEASAIVFGEEFRAMMADLADQLRTTRCFVCTGNPRQGQVSYEDLIESHAGGREVCVDTSDDDLAWLFYTSGTTGKPKGAMLTHANLAFMAVNWVADLTPLEPEDVGLHAAPLTHGAGFHSIALTLKGAQQVLLDPHRFDAENLCAAVEKHRVTNTWLVPTQIKILLNYAGLEKWDLSSLKWVVYGGSPMYVEDLKAAIRRIGPVFVQLYGQGETPMTGTYFRAQEHRLEGTESRRLASCGHVRSGIELRILDENDEEVPRGAVGEICVRGPSVMKGYWRRPDATAASLRGGWLHTGDVAHMDEDGYVYIMDRTTDMIISGGANVFPREVEEVLLDHPAVSEACVFGVPDELWGEAVKAVIVLDNGASATEEEIIGFVGERIASYKKPKSVDFTDALPKSAYGKILKRELRDKYRTEAQGKA